MLEKLQPEEEACSREMYIIQQQKKLKKLCSAGILRTILKTKNTHVNTKKTISTPVIYILKIGLYCTLWILYSVKGMGLIECCCTA